MRLCLATAFATTLLGSVGSALTVEEYNALDIRTQNTALSQIITGTYDYLSDQGASDEMLSCIRFFYTQQERVLEGRALNSIPGLQALYREIDIANVNGRLDLRIEDMVLGTMNAECESGG